MATKAKKPKAAPKDGLYPPLRPYSTGRLGVSEVHELYYEQSGNPQGKPVVFLHGYASGTALFFQQFAHVAQRHVGRGLLELDAQPGGVAERAVRVGEAVEEVAVRVVGGAGGGDHLAGSGEHVELEHRLVRAAVAERRRLDAHSGDGPTQGDRAQLRNAQGHESEGKRRGGEVLVRGHAQHVGGAVRAVDAEHAVEGGDVEPGDRGAIAGAEEVGGLLGQPHPLVGRYGLELPLQVCQRRVVGGRLVQCRHHPKDSEKSTIPLARLIHHCR